MRDWLINEYGYSLDVIPQCLGGKLDSNSINNGTTRHQQHRLRLLNPQSACSSYYLFENLSSSTRSPNNVVFLNNEPEKSFRTARTRENLSGSSLVAIAPLKSAQDNSVVHARVLKRESSSSSENDKRQRSRDSVNEEEPSLINASVIPKEQSHEYKFTLDF